MTELPEVEDAAPSSLVRPAVHDTPPRAPGGTQITPPPQEPDRGEAPKHPNPGPADRSLLEDDGPVEDHEGHEGVQSAVDPGRAVRVARRPQPPAGDVRGPQQREQV